jgi:hypothetical protein
VLVDLYVIVEAGAALLPLGQLVRLRRKLLERGTFDVFKQGTVAGPEVAGHAIVDLIDE